MAQNDLDREGRWCRFLPWPKWIRTGSYLSLGSVATADADCFLNGSPIVGWFMLYLNGRPFSRCSERGQIFDLCIAEMPPGLLHNHSPRHASAAGDSILSSDQSMTHLFVGACAKHTECALATRTGGVAKTMPATRDKIGT